MALWERDYMLERDRQRQQARRSIQPQGGPPDLRDLTGSLVVWLLAMALASSLWVNWKQARTIQQLQKRPPCTGELFNGAKQHRF